MSQQLHSFTQTTHHGLPWLWKNKPLTKICTLKGYPYHTLLHIIYSKRIHENLLVIQARYCYWETSVRCQKFDCFQMLTAMEGNSKGDCKPYDAFIVNYPITILMTTFSSESHIPRACSQLQLPHQTPQWQIAKDVLLPSEQQTLGTCSVDWNGKSRAAGVTPDVPG